MGESALEISRVPYHGLWTMPFRENTDPSFLWLGPSYRDAFATLRAAVLQNAGILLLTGEVGTGKTMLANALAESLRVEGVRVAKLLHADLPPHEFRHGVAEAFELPVRSNMPKVFLTHVGEFLRGAYARGEKVLLVIDEAQGFGTVLFDEIDELIREGRAAGQGKVNVLNVLLVAQTDVDADEVAVRSHLTALEPDQVADYIAFRLRVAGADHELFSADAIRAIATASDGVPRVINRFCNCALQIASDQGDSVVSVDVVREVPNMLGFTLNGRATVGADERSGARARGRWLAYAAIAVLAIGLGVTAYQGGRAVRARAGVPQSSVTVTSAPSARESGMAVATIGPSVRQPAARPSDIAPAAPAREEAAIVEAKIAEPVSAPVPSQPRDEIPPARKPPIAEVRPERPTPAPPTARRPAAAPVAGAMRVTPDAVSQASTRPPEDSSEDPGAIINWLLQRNRAGEK